MTNPTIKNPTEAARMTPENSALLKNYQARNIDLALIPRTATVLALHTVGGLWIAAGLPVGPIAISSLLPTGVSPFIVALWWAASAFLFGFLVSLAVTAHNTQATLKQVGASTRIFRRPAPTETIWQTLTSSIFSEGPFDTISTPATVEPQRTPAATDETTPSLA